MHQCCLIPNYLEKGEGNMDINLVYKYKIREDLMDACGPAYTCDVLSHFYMT